MRKILPALVILVLGITVLAGCGSKKPVVEDGMTVKLHYNGTLDDGSVFDTSEGRDPLEFVYGQGQMIPGFESALKDMKVGDTKTFTIPAAEAYGEYDESAVVEVPKDQLPPDLVPEVGMQLYAQSPMGVMPVAIKEVKEASVMIDYNHPLAGEALTFDVEIVELTKAEPAETGEVSPLEEAFPQAEPGTEPGAEEPAPESTVD